ncbi:hypothetical protein GCM10009555_107450 [Acrocarpospora macrocephala]|uniref:G domain-containing protein n=1 Tax=Acrocarpospora macrocephala TaxID=150177 RepID=A0A5M3X795_9ACTN|nr:GTPase [Acrocarpospora macrocephala]GES16960.1 hypothetical protein Amac_105580 [Acrocarpospora macrocephala]
MNIREAIALILGPDALTIPPHEVSHPCVVVYGPYDGGKTSLIKRLLVEDGTEAPSWLTVGAQPETFESGSLTSGGLTYIDTPGLAGRSAEHGRLADEALSSADLVLVVLPQQRVVEDARKLAELATAGFTPETTILVIGRCDTAGPDPDTAPDEFIAFLERRRDALTAVLPAELAAAPVHLVAADPYGLVGNGPQPDLSSYAEYRSWDGVAALRTRLSSLKDRLPELRAAAEARFWIRLVAEARDSASEESERLQAYVDEAAGRRARTELFEQRLNEIDLAASETLRSSISRELQGIVRVAAGMDAEEVRTRTESRLQDCLTAWSGTWGTRLKELAREAEHDLALEAIRLESLEFDRWTEDLWADPPRAQSSHTVPSTETLSKLGAPLTTMTRAGVKLRLSLPVPMEEAHKIARTLTHRRAELKKEYFSKFKALDQLSSTYQSEKEKLVSQYGESLGNLLADNTVFDSFQDAERARKWIGGLDIVGEFVPAAISLGGLLLGQWNDRRAERADRERREADQKKIDQATAHFTDNILGHPTGSADGTWRAAVATMRTRFEEDPTQGPAVATAQQRKAELATAVQYLDSL